MYTSCFTVFDRLWHAISLKPLTLILPFRNYKIESWFETLFFSLTDCSAAGPGSGLVPLEDFTYANSFMGCVIQWNLAQTNFLGVSVRKEL